ncbi:Golgi phosphoprotein 3 (GPP34) [Streptomyces sp. yr375]|uniref:GOLPH3/VPS74 family protein n=1 Tax=Streptomyces sp. yr375 TaxID=1761906 RepID=UPI0008C926AC|nr:GPP34 family phosphoprotein [Streptomyces sp. yr375]SEP59108.1 Golgi phosphoprotein 3 (GPP34) [Streptomyces sp. yr375]
MTTARDLMIVVMDVTPVRPIGQGDLSLALAGAEAIDLVETGAVALDGDVLVPGPPTAPADPLLDVAASSLVRVAPYESVEDWLWRRGRGLASAYANRLEADGLAVRPRHRRLRVRSGRPEPVDSPDRRHATDRWAADEPVLVALAAAVGLREEPADGLPELPDDAVLTVLAAVGDALTELEAVRQRRSIEDAAFDNIWRAP